MKKILTFSLVMFIISVMNIMAATWYVDPLGTDDESHGTTSGSGAFQTIQYAIGFVSVVDGDVINIAAGTYNQALTIGKSLYLIGSGPASNPTTIITSIASRIINLSVTGNSYSFKNLIIEGNNTNNGIYAGSTININSITMQDVIARNCQVALYLSEYWPGEDPLTTTVNTLNMDNVTMTNNKFIGTYIGKTVLSGTITNSTFTNNGYSNDLPDVWQKTGLQFVNFDEASVPHVIVTNSTFINNGAGASNIERTGLILYTAYNAFSANELLTVTGCTFQDHPLYAVRIKNGYQVGNTATVNGTFTNNYLDIWFNRVTGYTSSTTNVRRTLEGIKTVGAGPIYDYATIQDAISGATSGDKINIAVGVYNETVNGDGKNSLTLQGTDPNNRPVLNGSTHFSVCNDLIIKNLMLKNTASSPIAYIGGTNLTLDKVTLDGENIVNHFGISGGQINGNVTITNCEFLNIKAWAAFDTRSGSGGPTSGSLLNKVVFTGNLIDNTVGHINFRGTICYNTDSVIISNNVVQNVGSSTNSFGGIIKVLYADNCWFTNNLIKDVGTSGYNPTGEAPYGAGFMPRNVTNLYVTDNTFQNNNQAIAVEPRNSVQGGCNDGVLPGGIISNNIFIGNTYDVYIPVTLHPASNPSALLINNNNFTGTIAKAVNFGYPTGTLNATNNWWGTAIESQILAKLSGTITYDPWIGKTQPPADNNIAVSVTSSPIPLPNSGGTIQFSNVGINNVNPTITVQKIFGIPGTPTSAGTPIPVYFQITPTNLANYTFEATIVLDVSSIPGFNANTVVMMSSDGTNWLGSNGLYNATAHTYTFTTNHFSTIAFVNPVLANEINLYVSTSIGAYSNTVYPNTSWNTALTSGADGFDWTPSATNHDWTYKNKTGTFYIIPVGSLSSPRSFYEAHVKVAWNQNVVSSVNVTQGNIFPAGTFLTSMSYNSVQIDWASLDGNHTPDGQKYIAKLDFSFDNDTSGFSAISIQDVTIYYDNGQSGWQEATVVTQDMGGKVKCYLGDFASPSSQDMGDGLINGTDLNTTTFTTAYWSHYNDPSTPYLSKYDVGPTLPARYYFGLPHPDGVINFEDLAVFSMGYSKTGSGTLPDNPKPIIFSLDKMEKGTDGLLRSPVRISGSINDLRAFSMKMNHGSDIEYAGVEMAGQMLEGTNFLIGKSESGKVFADGAAFGNSLSKEGIIGYVLFIEKTAGNHNASIENVIARNSGNLDLEVRFEGDNFGSEVPKVFQLNQNYPNPFNPVTKIEYALPKDVKVSIKIYDILGRQVSVLVNEVQKAGYYKLDWNGSSLSSGIYFYQMVAGDFVAVKKMMLIK